VKYQREAAFLKDQLGSYGVSLMRNACVAGGAVTSVFSSSSINDFDLFFTSQKHLDNALKSAPRNDKTVETDSALSIVSEGRRLQLVKVVLGTPSEIINKFDFTICEGAFHLEEGFCFGTNFLEHLAQRRLVFNLTAEYPICSLYRAVKFIKRGFHLSGIDAIKLGLRIQSLKIDTYAELRKQLMGIDTLFLKDLVDALKGQETKKYDLNEFLSLLESWLEKLDVLVGQEG